MSLDKAKEVKKRKLFSIVWVIPFITVVICFILIWNNSFNKGPSITVTIANAEGIEPGKTLVKLHSVPIGLVTNVNLDDNFDNVILTVEMDKGTDELLKQDTIFWLVKPRVQGVAVSGLDTILSGSYIQCEPGNSSESSRSFTALDNPPLTSPNLSGINVRLNYNGGKRLNTGDIILYRGFNVGNIISSEFDTKSNTIKYIAFIQDPYTNMLNASSRFWISSGIDFSLGFDGVKVDSDSLNNLIQGSISFDSFESEDNNRIGVEQSIKLFENKSAAYLDYLSTYPSFVAFIGAELKNIKEGSKIIYQGIQIGTVLKAPFLENLGYIFSNKDKPVLMSFHADKGNLKILNENIEKHLKKGEICLKSVSSSIVKPNDTLELEFIKDNSCKIKQGSYLGYRVLPFSSKIDDGVNFKAITDKIEDIDAKGISDEAKIALRSFSSLMKSIERNSDNLSDAELFAKFSQSLDNLNKTLSSFNESSKIYGDIVDLLNKIDNMLNDIGPAVNEIGQSPNSIIFNSGSKDYEPKRAQKD